MIKSNCLICDIDGTIANGNHRQHFVRTKPRNWDAYDAFMHNDTPIAPVIEIINRLHSSDLKIILCSGRKEKDRGVIEQWLDEQDVLYDELYVRPTLDHRDDTVVKEEMLAKIRQNYNVIAAIDDRVKVVDMWRKNGVFCLDVNQSREEF